MEIITPHTHHYSRQRCSIVSYFYFQFVLSLLELVINEFRTIMMTLYWREVALKMRQFRISHLCKSNSVAQPPKFSDFYHCLNNYYNYPVNVIHIAIFIGSLFCPCRLLKIVFISPPLSPTLILFKLLAIK